MANLYLEHARELLGMGPDWQMAKWADLGWRKPTGDPSSRMRVTGVCAPVLPDGRVAWEYEDKATRKSVTFTFGEHAAWVRAWEIKTGKCSQCSTEHPGKQWMGWNCKTGDHFVICRRCNGTNRTPEVDRGDVMDVSETRTLGEEVVMPERPLFIPLRREHFESFQNSTKPEMEEYRPYGARWNEDTCRVGRAVILSLGYGKKSRLRGRVAGFRVDREEIHKTEAWIAIYGPGPCAVACTKIVLEVANG